MKKTLLTLAVIFASLTLMAQVEVPTKRFENQSQKEKVLPNQFSDYVQFRKDHQRPEFNRHHRPEFGPQHFPMQPRPLSVTVKGDKVIVIFKKEDYNKLRPMVNQRIMWKERPRGKVQEMLIEKMEH